MTDHKEVVIILDNIRSAYNVGSAFRTADGAGVKKIYICGISPYPPHNRLTKTALGATFYVDWEYTKDINEAIHKVKKEGYATYAVENEVENTKNYKQAVYPNKTAFLFGNEVKGIEPKTLSECDKIIEIPMFGKKNSLNVATTIGIILFDFISR